MKFENMVKLESTVLGNTPKNATPYFSLKVFNPEDSTREYNVHPIIRSQKNDGGMVYVLAEKPDSAVGVSGEYLTYVLAYYNGQYVTWLCNYDTGGFHQGHYYDGDFQAASKDFMIRGWGWEELLPKTMKDEWKELQEHVDNGIQFYEGDPDDYDRGAYNALTEIKSKMNDLEGDGK